MYLILTTLFTFAFSACFPGPNITFAASLARTGSFMNIAGQMRDGYNLAVDRINSLGGIQCGGDTYYLEFRDSETDDRSVEAEVTNNYNTFVADSSIDFLVGPYSSKLSLKAAEVARDNQRVIIHGGASTSALHSYGYYNFMTYAESGLYWVPSMVELQTLGLQSVCVVSIPTAFPMAAARGAMEKAAELGIRTPTDIIQHTHADDAEIRAALIQCRDGDYDAIFLNSNKEVDSTKYVEILESLNYHPKALGITVLGADPVFVQNEGDATLGVFGPTQWTEHVPHQFQDDVFGDAKSYAQHYYDKYATDDNRNPPTYPCAGASVSILAYKFAIERVATYKTENINQNDIAAALHALDVPSFWSQLKWEADGSIDKPVYTTQIQINAGEEGIFPIVAPAEFASEHEATGEPFTVIYPRLQYKINSAQCAVTTTSAANTTTTSAANPGAMTSCDDNDDDSTMTILLIVILVLFILQSMFLCSIIYYEKTMRPLFMFGTIKE